MVACAHKSGAARCERRPRGTESYELPARWQRTVVRPLSACYEPSFGASDLKEEPIMSSIQDAPTAELVLAAVDRAVVQSVRPVSDVSGGAISDHLALSPRSGAWRIARRHLLALVAEGAVRQGRRNGSVVWGLTSSGRRRLARIVRLGVQPALPQSPQHRLWSDSRRLAGQEVDRVRAELAAVLGEGTRLLREAT